MMVLVLSQGATIHIHQDLRDNGNDTWMKMFGIMWMSRTVSFSCRFYQQSQ